MIENTNAHVSRRTVLRGLGTAMALPFLESISPPATLAATLAGGKSAAGTPPVRMAFIFVPNGVNMDEWTPAGLGSRYELSSILSPLEKVKDDILVLSGLTHDKGRANDDGAGDHARSASVFLTGAQPIKTSGANIRSGVSVDQVAAEAIGNVTRFPSLELGCERGRNSGNCDSGYSCAYSNNISWKSPTTPMGKEIDPRRVFDRLFANDVASDVAANRARRRRQRLSILDFVLEDARKLKDRLGVSDQRKLDEYFSGVRAIELRVANAERGAPQKRIIEPDGLPAESGQLLDYKEHLNLLTDMMVLAFQGDVTRVSTFMFARAGSNRNYRFIGVPDGHHELSHHQRRQEKLAKIREINRFHVEQLAYFLERLKSVKEGDGTLLDNCMVVYGSAISDGNRHNNENLPIVLAGRGGGSIDTGRHVRYSTETPMCNLFLSMLDRVGASTDSIGDSTGRLGQLTL